MAQESESINFDYDWGDFSTGNFRLDSTGGFFGVRHPEHFREGQDDFSVSNNQDDFPMSNNQEDFPVSNNQQDFPVKIEKVDFMAEPADENFNNDAENNQNNINTPTPVKIEPADALSSDVEKLQINGRPEPKNLVSSLKSRRVHETAAIQPNQLNQLNVFEKGKLYEQQRKRRIEAEEQRLREMRKFHAKPAPKFQAIHAAQNLKRAKQPLQFTCPMTPEVVRRHKEERKRVNLKLQAIEEEQRAKQFVSQEPDVLRQRPFVPQKNDRTPTKAEPFNLHSDERSKVRQQYNEQIRLEIERKQKEREEQEKSEDERVRRELRKATTFKAAPYRK